MGNIETGKLSQDFAGGLCVALPGKLGQSLPFPARMANRYHNFLTGFKKNGYIAVKRNKS